MKQDFRNKMYEHLKDVYGLKDSVFAQDKRDIIYKGIYEDIVKYSEDWGMKFHRMCKRGHVVSSQAACFNLFMPIMKSGKAVEILNAVKPDIKEIEGYWFEYWSNECGDKSKGLLNDHSSVNGTDADFAVLYKNKDGKRCLWLVEHKLTENKFTQCNVIHKGKHKYLMGFCSRFKPKELLDEPDKCYYTGGLKYNYWILTKEFGCFPGLDVNRQGCPFKDGMCQLWRNVLLAKAAQKKYGYDKAYFSVVKPEDNHYLDNSINEFKEIVEPGLFSVFSPKELVEVALKQEDVKVRDWANWYKKVYLDY